MMFIMFPVQACTWTESSEGTAVFKSDPEIQGIKPQKPVKVKLKRSKEGDYSWELTGHNANKVIEEDKKLREEFGKK
jgi:hypothetical protein